MLQITAIILIALGLYGLVTHRHVIRIIVSLNIMQIGINIFIISIGFVMDGVAPILSSETSTNAALFVDPLPQALVLTAIVIGIGTTALGLALAKIMQKKYGTLHLDEMGEE